MNKESLKKSSKRTLELTMIDAANRIANSADNEEYVKKQQELIKNCKEALEEKTCPKCKNNEIFGDGRDALSRKDNETAICSECGMQEAMEEFYGRG